MKRDVRLFINDIIENMSLIEQSTKDISEQEFKQDRLLVDATLRRLEIIGEAIKNIPLEFTEKYSHIPWKRISGFRDVLTHMYFGVSLERVLDIIKKGLPELKREIIKIQKALSSKS